MYGINKSITPGALDQSEGSEILKKLNRKTATRYRNNEALIPVYYLITTSFDPKKMDYKEYEKLKAKLGRKLSIVFEQEENDGIVPTYGKFGELDPKIESDLFKLPDSNKYLLQNSRDVHHHNYPDSKEFRD